MTVRPVILSPATRKTRQRHAGFTLLEVLIALAVLAIALIAFVSAGAQNADYATYIRDRSVAEWVARNQLAEYQLQSEWPGIGKKDGDTSMGRAKWHWVADIQSSPDADVRRIDIRVYPVDPQSGKPDADSIVLISGFITRHPQAQGAPGADAAASANSANDSQTDSSQ